MAEHEQDLFDLYVGLIVNGLFSKVGANVKKEDLDTAFDVAGWMIERRRKEIQDVSNQ